jgi:cytochrome c5
MSRFSAVVWCAAIALSGERVGALRAQDVALVTRELPPGEGVVTVRAICTTCHGPALIAQQRLSRDGWSREIDKMAGWGASVPPGQRDVLLKYLTLSFGTESIEPPADATTGAALLQARCRTCHDLTLIEQQQLDAAGWARELDKMIGWGAVLNDLEKVALIEYLGHRRMR